MASAILYVFEISAAISALGILFVRSVFHAALLLIICLLSLAGVYVVYNAEFIAVTQILVYAGGVLVLMLFGIMLTSRITGKPLIIKNQYVLVGSVMGVMLASVLIKLLTEQNFYAHQTQPLSGNAMTEIGIALMSNYVLPFEVAGILLLIALIGAAVTASSFNSKKQ